MSGGQNMRLIDVSSYQGEPNYFAVKQGGYSGVYMKVGDGNGVFMDSQFQRNRVEARKVNDEANGFLRGYYWEAFGDGDPIKQAQAFVSWIDDLQVEEILVLVWGDYATSVDPGNWCSAFIDEVRKKYANGLWIYMNRSELDNHNWNGVLIDRKVPLIVSTLEGYPVLGNSYNGHSLVMEQYSETGTVQGISGNVDLNEFNGDINLWKSLSFNNNTMNPKYEVFNASGKIANCSNEDELVSAWLKPENKAVSAKYFNGDDITAIMQSWSKAYSAKPSSVVSTNADSVPSDVKAALKKIISFANS